MKKFLCFLCILLLGFGMSGVANALLYDRGGGLIYDDYLNITLLQDANYAMTSGYDSDGRMTWDNAVAWADQLEYQGYKDWRLPDAHNHDGSGPVFGFNATSEMGHMYYGNLGGSASGSFPGMDFTDSVTGETRSFQNLQHGSSGSDSYWSVPPSILTSGAGYTFNFTGGSQGLSVLDLDHVAWAVREGDSFPGGQNPVPEPTTMLLFGAGLVGLAGFGRKKFKK